MWLEPNDPANVALYERFGFHVTGHAAGVDAMPSWWLMVREPPRRMTTPHIIQPTELKAAR